MTTELEEQFFKTFGIEPIEYRKNVPCLNFLSSGICNITDERCNPSKCNEYRPDKTSRLWRDFMEVYPEITDRKLLEIICIYNSFQNAVTSLFIPFDINNIKDIALQVIMKSIKDKSLNNYYCNDVEKLKTKIQQLFKEEE